MKKIISILILLLINNYNNIEARKLRIQNLDDNATLSLAKDKKMFGQIRPDSDLTTFRFQNEKTEIKISSQFSKGLLGIYTLSILDGTKDLNISVEHNKPQEGSGYKLTVDYAVDDYPK